jgi:hypothetical protein
LKTLSSLVLVDQEKKDTIEDIVDAVVIVYSEDVRRLSWMFETLKLSLNEIGLGSLSLNLMMT